MSRILATLFFFITVGGIILKYGEFIPGSVVDLGDVFLRITLFGLASFGLYHVLESWNV